MKPKRRKRIAKGIYRDRYGLSAAVKVGSRGEERQREKRFPFDTPIRDIRAWQDSIRVELKSSQRPTWALAPGTLEADAKRYLAQVAHLASYKSRVCEVNAWTALYGRIRRV